MLQHEVDHLDGVLMLDRTTREQRKLAMRALREGDSYTPDDFDTGEGEPADEANARVRLAYFGTSEHAAAVLRTLALGPLPPGPRDHPCRPPEGPRPQALAAARGRAGE